MQNKYKDVEYCGVDKSVVNSVRPRFYDEAIKVLNYYIKERYAIHIKKDVLKLKQPYTNDKLLSVYKFTNIRREHDKNSKWLIDNISNNNNLSFEDKIYKSILYRIYNRNETAEIIDLVNINFSDDSWLEKACNRITEFLKDNQGYRFYTNAYKCGGVKRGLYSSFPESSHYNYSPLYFIKDCISNNFHEDLVNCNTQEEVFNLLKSVNGFGRFIAYQIFVDLTYIKEFPFSENEFTVAGPGCYYGLQLLTGKDSEDSGFNGMSSEEIIFWMRNNLVEEFNRRDLEFDPDKVFIDLPKEDRKFNVMSLENIMCEFSKYYSIYSGIRKGRMKYVPGRS